ncbi:DUF2163 domain-containing protein [Paracoccaceae bacterium GXU_MW_L88]
MSGLEAHLATGCTTLCRCWKITRRDGAVLGFTDHDGDLTFDGVVYRADRALSAGVAVSSLGLSVDNGSILGALAGDGIRDEDLRLGRYDGAEVTEYLVNWADPTAREQVFAGRIGAVSAGPGYFEAELRSAAEALNKPVGRTYGRACDAALGDARCGVDLRAESLTVETQLAEVIDEVWLVFARGDDRGSGWFSGGVLRWTGGALKGAMMRIDSHEMTGGQHRLRLETGLRERPAVGDAAALVAGCDRSLECCAAKFGNVANFRGFPHLPGDEWLTLVPEEDGENDGGKRR